MTGRLPVLPGPLEAYCQQFDSYFRQLNQRDRFRRYLAGLLLPAERHKTLTALANRFARGEIDEQEYEHRLAVLLKSSDSRAFTS
jgi:hypothetical protein